jgi:hypothetical protein
MDEEAEFLFRLSRSPPAARALAERLPFFRIREKDLPQLLNHCRFLSSCFSSG